MIKSMQEIMQDMFGIEEDDAQEALDDILKAPIQDRIALALYIGGTLSLEPGIKATFGKGRLALEWPQDTFELGEEEPTDESV